VVLLIACANLASANLAQGARRQREMAVRSALGAGRRRLIRQVLIENVGIAIAGAAVGVLFAWGALRAAIITQGAEFPHITTIGINMTVLAIAFAAAIFAGLATGVLPALQASRSAPNDVLGGSARGTVHGGRGLAGRVLVGAEIAMALVLVTGAGLFVKSFRTVLSKPLGFDTENVSYAEIALGGARYQRDTALVAQYWTRLAQALRESPGVQAASVTNFVPLVRGGTGFIEIEGSNVPGAGAGYRMVGEGYFDALGMTRYSGRDFGLTDGPATERVGLVNKSMAERYWPGESPIGRRVRAPSMEPSLDGQPSAWITVIGVVSDVRHFGYEKEPAPELFVLYRQLPAWRLTAMSVIARGTGGVSALEETMRAQITSADPDVPADISSLDAAAKRTTAPRRFTMQVLGVFGVLSLLLAAIGVYGILSFSVAQRTREIAVRSALGADRTKLLRLVLGSAGAVIVVGVAAGLAGVYAGGKLVESMLFEVTAYDPLIVTLAALVLVMAGAFAAFVPARRAVRIDPMEVLRNDG
jgi:putative ABC transport system permease protein